MLWYCLLVLYGLLAQGWTRTVHIYVSPTGSDTNTGLDVHHPLRTIEEAKSKLDQSGIKGNTIIVELLRGYYDLTSTLHFTHKYTAPVTFRAYNGQEVHVTGGKRIPSLFFHKVTDSSVLKVIPQAAHAKVLQIHLPDVGIQNYGIMSRFGDSIRKTSWLELFINGDPTRLAQYPNEGFIDITGVNDTHGTTFQYGAVNDDQWVHERDAWAYGYWYYSWADYAVKIAKVDPHAHTMTLARKTLYGLRVGHFNQPSVWGWGTQGGYFRVINMLTELDQPGEYYIDRSTGILYVWPNTQDGTLSSSDIIYASMISDCIKIDPVSSNLHFEDFTLEACRKSGFKITSGRDITIQNMEIRNTGALGVYCHGDCRSLTVSKCEIHHTCGAMWIEGGIRSTLTPSGVIVEDNHIWKYARVGAVGYNAVTTRGVGSAVRYNHIWEGQYTGISWSGNDHLMEYNHIHHMCINASDCGAIHTGRDWTWRGNVIRYNHVHHTLTNAPGAQVRGIMLDDEYSSVTIEHNVFYDNDVHVNIGGGRDNIVRYNVMYNATGDGMQVDGRGLTSKNMAELQQRLGDDYYDEMLDPGKYQIVLCETVPYKNALWSSRYPKLANMTKPQEPAGNEIYDNIFYNSPGTPAIYYGHQRINIPEYYKVANNFRSTSPTDFWSPADADFRVRCAAAEWANAINFPQPIDVNHVGPRHPTGPTYMQKPLPFHKTTTHPTACSHGITVAPATKTPRTPYYTDGSGPNTVYPNIPKYGCWLIISGCPLHKNGTQRDVNGEKNDKTGVIEANCLKQASLQWQFCGSKDGTVTAVFGPTGAMTIGSRHCYFADYGCPRHGGPKPGRLIVDTWGEAHGALDSEEKCLARAHAEWVFCGSDVDHPESSIYGPTGATRHIGGGCWIKVSACPSDTKLTGFFYDKWGATTFNTDKDEAECLARADYFWLQCGLHRDHPVTAVYRPTARSKTVP